MIQFDDLLKSLIAQAPTVFVLLWIFQQLREDVKFFMQSILTMLNNCLEDTDSNAKNVNNAPK